MPSALQFDETLSRGARDLWAALEELCREHRGVYALGSTVAAAIECSPASLRRWRQELVESGWLLYDAPGGRGVPSLWVPLRRARKVTKPAVPPVDNSTGRPRATRETRSSGAPFDQGNPLTMSELPRGPYKERAGEEEEAPEAPSSSAHQDPPCGRCAPDTRLLEVDDDVVVINPHTGRRFPAGSRVPCPYCHPLTVPAF